MSARYNAYNQEYAYQRAGNVSARALETSETDLIESSKSFAITALAGIAVFSVMYLSMNGLTKYGDKFAENSKAPAEIEAISQESIAVRALDSIKSLGSKSVSEAAKPVELPLAEISEVAVEESSIATRITESVKNLTKSEKIEIINVNVEPVSAPVAEKAEPETPKEIFAQKAEEALSKKNTEEFLWHSIRAEDYTPVATAAIMGNYMQESGLNPANRPVVVRNGAMFGGLGFAQWMGGRKQKLIEKYPDSYETAESQVDYTFHELDTNYREVKNDILNTDDVSEAVEIFQTRYEKCDPVHCNFAARDRLARKYLEKYSNITE